MKSKMKRWLSLVLAMVLLCGTLPVAFAAETGTPLYEQMGYESADEFVESWFFDRVNYDWVCAQYQARLAELTSDPDKAFEEAYYGWDWAMVDEYYDSREEFLRDAAMQLVQLDSYSYEPPVSVQLNGEKVAFSDAQPEMKNNRTMVPFRAIAEALGATVEYESGAITAVKDGTRYDFTLGGDTLTLSDDATGAEIKTVTLDAAPYEKDGRTYVPVRFFAEAFGLTVQWDDYRQVAVLYDRDALVEQIDEEFSIVNQWLAAQPARDPAQTMRTVAALRVLYTQLNSIDGDETTVLVDGTLEVVDGSGGMSMNVQVDLQGVLALLSESMEPYWSQDLIGEVGQWQELLKNVQLEMVLDAESGTLYLRCPVLLKLLASSLGEQAPAVSTDVWLEIPDAADVLVGGEMPLWSEWVAQADDATMGALIVGVMEQSCAYSYSMLWDEVQQSVDAIASFAGDDCFTRRGQQYKAELSTALPEEYGYVSGAYTLDLSDGSIEGQAEYRISDGYSDVLMTLTFAGDAQKGDVAVTVHVKNQSITEITLTLTQQPAQAGSEVQLPDPDEVMTLDAWEELLSGAAA